MSSDPRFVAVALPNHLIADADIWFVDSKVSGGIKDTVGKVEEKIGDLTGLTSFQTSGKERQAEGEVEHKQAQAQGYVEGTKDCVTGTFDKVAGSFTGNTSQEISGGCLVSRIRSTQQSTDVRLGDVRKEKGKVQQEANKS